MVVIFALTIVGGFCVAVSIGLTVGVWLASREPVKTEKDDAEQTWGRTAAKETKPPPIVITSPIDYLRSPGPTASKKASMYLVNRALAESKSEAKRQAARIHDHLLDQRLEQAAKPDGITVARVKRVIAKKRKSRK